MRSSDDGYSIGRAARAIAPDVTERPRLRVPRQVGMWPADRMRFFTAGHVRGVSVGSEHCVRGKNPSCSGSSPCEGARNVAAGSRGCRPSVSEEVRVYLEKATSAGRYTVDVS